MEAATKATSNPHHIGWMGWGADFEASPPFLVFHRFLLQKVGPAKVRRTFILMKPQSVLLVWRILLILVHSTALTDRADGQANMYII